MKMSSKHTIEIIEFSEELSESIKTLNYEWIEKHFRLEVIDITTLSNPQKYIIDTGGYIYYAKLNGEIVGTVSLIKKSEDVYELSKMAVSNKAQGYGVATILLEHCMYVANKKQLAKLVLYCNTRLKSAMHLYNKFGFKQVELETGLYERADIKLEKTL